jgi:pimeloyl-ACP methyl ester carboxylesterase
MEDGVPPPRVATARLATGIRVHYAAQGDPRGEVLLFLHGYADSWFSFSRLLPLLPARYLAYAVDQRGHGDSDRPTGGYEVDQLAADVVAFLGAVGASRATLVGHSGGTITARRVAQTRPERVARLVLIGAALLDEAPPSLLQAVRALEDPVPTEFVRAFQAGAAHVPLPETFLEGLVSEACKLPARVWVSALEGLFATNDAAELGRIAAPTLLLAGEQDTYFPPEDQARLTAAIPGARLMVYPDTGHAPHWERPERVAADLDAFVRAT